VTYGAFSIPHAIHDPAMKSTITAAITARAMPFEDRGKNRAIVRQRRVEVIARRLRTMLNTKRASFAALEIFRKILGGSKPPDDGYRWRRSD
jgi:hypothetical protein